MLLREGTILCVRNLYDEKISAITQENIIFHLDSKYYSDFEICSFMDIFKIETNNYKKIYWGESDILPHLGAILNYVENHYNSTYRFFNNRNFFRPRLNTRNTSNIFTVPNIRNRIC